MKIVVTLVPLFFVASTGANFFDQFFDGPNYGRCEANFRADYRSDFARKHRTETGFERGRELFRNGFETFGYGDGKPTVIPCGDDPNGQRSWAEQSLACADALTAEMNSVLRETASRSAAKAKGITDEYVRISRGILEAAKTLKVPQETEGRRAFDLIAFHDLDFGFFNVPDFVYNVTGTADEELVRKLLFFGVPGRVKPNATAEGLLSLLGRLSEDSSVRHDGLSDGLKALRERVGEMNELSKPFGSIENSTTYVPSLRWAFLKRWEYYDTEFLKDAKLSTHQAKLGGIVSIIGLKNFCS